VPTYNYHSLFQSGISVVDVLTELAGIFASKGEVRRLMKEGGLFVNKEKISDDMLLTSDHLINNNYVLVQKGKKNYFLINVH
jgi:tyrosyl-tRNA synthetase